MKKYIKYIIALLVGTFGVLTLYLSGSVIFDLFGMRAKQGNYVLFVIWVNFICGFIYLVASYGFIKSKYWTIKILTTSLLLLILTFIAFLIYVNSGGIHKNETFGALAVRSAITLLATITAYLTITKNYKK
jgi:drug/metabolite transporter (DMT)-like permease